MARMSIDDMFLRDPRVLRLAKACGWSKFEARGRLLDVFALVYDRVDAGADDIVQAVDIDIAAEREGLAALMIEHDLAESVRRGVRIRGAKERTNYLATRHESGRLGGLKSGETRRNKAKQQTKVTFAETEGRVNPSASASASAVVDPDPAVAVVVVPPAQESLGFAALKSKADRTARKPSSSPLPSDWTSRAEEVAWATSAGLSGMAEAAAFRDHHTAKGSRFVDWNAAFRNWLRNAVKFSGAKPGQPAKTTGRAEPLPNSAYLADEGRSF